MQSRRQALKLAGLALAASLAPRASAAAVPPLRLGTLTFGTVSWQVETIRRQGFAARRGLEIETLRLANNEAGRIAFEAASVDAIVTDLLLAARLKSEGKPLAFLPFSATEGAVMVPAGSPIRGIADLAGRKIGVAGGALDKSWLLLQAEAKARFGLDLVRAATPAYGAAPLLSQQLESGNLDAALLFWTFCARLEAKGFRRLVSVAELMDDFGVSGSLALVGYIFNTGSAAATGGSIAAYAGAVDDANRLLGGGGAEADAAWAAIRPLMQAEDDATFAALRRGFVAGIPRRPVAAEQADAEKLYGVLAGIGGAPLLGGTRFPEGLYWAKAGAAP